MDIRPYRLPAALIAGVVLWSSFGLAAAEEEPREEIEFAPPVLVPVEEGLEEADGLTLQTSGHVQIWSDTFSRPAGEGMGAGLYQQTRLRGSGAAGLVRVVLEADLLSGRIVGAELSPLPEIADHGARPFQPVAAGSAELIDPRNLYLEWESPVGLLRAGLQTSDWGLGLLANGGGEDDYFFGTTFGGDRSARVLFATAPLRPFAGPGWTDNVFVAIGADTVYRDENADWLAGDRAYQVLGSVLFEEDDTRLGTYVAYRNQTDRDLSTLNIAAFDVYGEHRWESPTNHLRYRLAAEAVYLHGETTRADGPEVGAPVRVAAAGGAAHFDITHVASRLGLQLRSGFASGDANPRGSSLHRFRFDPNYRAGLVLFDHHLAAWSRHSVAGAHDALRLRDSPRGLDNLVESGSVTNALFIHPVFLWGATEELTFATGLLGAFAHRPVRDLLASFERGGDVVGVAGATEPGRTLGWEALFGVRYRCTVWRGLSLEYRGEAAFFLPGDVFDDALGQRDDPTGLLRAFVTASW